MAARWAFSAVFGWAAKLVAYLASSAAAHWVTMHTAERKVSMLVIVWVGSWDYK